MRTCYICALYGGQSNNPTQRAHLQQANSEYTLFASMTNVTSEQFMNFLDDVESSMAKDGFLEEGNSTFTILDKYVCTSNHMAMRVIWDKSPEFFYKIV